MSRSRIHSRINFRRKNNPDRNLPEFSIDNINSSNARIDQVTINFPKIAIQYSISDQEEFERYKITLKDSYLFDGTRLGTSPLNFSDYYILDGSRAYFKKAYKWGNYKLVRFPMRLKLNPTRFYANLTPHKLDNIENLSSRNLLSKNKEQLQVLRGYSLDQNDNYLTEEARKASANLQTSLMSYLNAIRSEFIECFRDYTDYSSLLWENADNTLVQLQSNNEELVSRTRKGFIRSCDIQTDSPVIPILDWRGWQIYRTEIYWDFKHDNAVEFVKSIAPQLFSLSNRVFTYTKKFKWEDDSKKSRIMNSHIICGELKKNVKLVIYAKTPTRIRFEVRYLRESLRSQFTIPKNATQVDVDNIYHIPLLLSYATDDATMRLRKFVAALDFNKPDYRSYLSAPDIASFMYAFYEACDGSKRIMETIISALVNNGTVATTRGSELQKVLSKLCPRSSEKYFEKTGSQRMIYKLAEKYTPIIDNLVDKPLRKRAKPDKPRQTS